MTDWEDLTTESLNKLIQNRRSLIATLEKEIEEITEELKKRPVNQP